MFRVICLLHSAIAVASGTLMMFYTNEASVFGLASRLRGSTPHDQLLIETSESFSGLLLFVIGLVLLMVSFARDRDFQAFFAKGCVLFYIAMAVWRVCFEGKLEDLAHEWLRQALGDLALAASWIFFLVYNWREKYD